MRRLRDGVPYPLTSRNCLPALLTGGPEDGHLVTSPAGSVWRDVLAQPHRVDGPAEERPGSRQWRRHGLAHRVDGPAIESRNEESWFLFGVLHREGAPARPDRGWWYLAGKQVDPGTRLSWRPDLQEALEERRAQLEARAVAAGQEFEWLASLHRRHASCPPLAETVWESFPPEVRERFVSLAHRADDWANWLGAESEGHVLTDVSVVTPVASDADPALFAYSTTGTYHPVGRRRPDDDALATTVQLWGRTASDGVALECVLHYSYLDQGASPALNHELSRTLLPRRFRDVRAAEEFAFHSLNQLNFEPKWWAPPAGFFGAPKL